MRESRAVPIGGDVAADERAEKFERKCAALPEAQQGVEQVERPAALRRIPESEEILGLICSKFRTDSFTPGDWIYETLAVLESKNLLPTPPSGEQGAVNEPEEK